MPDTNQAKRSNSTGDTSYRKVQKPLRWIWPNMPLCNQEQQDPQHWLQRWQDTEKLFYKYLCKTKKQTQTSKMSSKIVHIKNLNLKGSVVCFLRSLSFLFKAILFQVIDQSQAPLAKLFSSPPYWGSKVYFSPDIESTKGTVHACLLKNIKQTYFWYYLKVKAIFIKK